MLVDTDTTRDKGRLTSTNALSVVAFPQQSVNTTDRKRETSLGGTPDKNGLENVLNEKARHLRPDPNANGSET
jgi:hypothetical protein